MRMRIAAFLLLFSPVGVWAERNPGTTAAPVLQIPVGARAHGMGSAFTAVADDISTLYYNPAGLSNLDHKEVSMMYLKGVEGQNLEYISAGTPIPYSGLIGEGFTSLAASILFSQNGTLKLNRTDANGSLLGSETLSAGGDLVLTVGYSEKAGEMEFGQASEAFSIAHFIGVSGKLIRSTLAEQYSAVAFAGDIGYYMESPETGLRFGLSALNMGTEMKFIEEGDPLPLTVRTGFSWSPDFGRRTRVRDERNLLLALDGDYLPGDRQWHANFGAEYIPLSGYSIRVGYRFNRDLAGVTFGFGGDFRDMRLAYSWGMQDSLSDVHRISITYRFGKVPGYKREFKRRPYIESMPEREELRDIEDKTPRELDPPRRPRRQAPDSQRLAPGWIY